MFSVWEIASIYTKKSGITYSEYVNAEIDGTRSLYNKSIDARISSAGYSQIVTVILIVCFVPRMLGTIVGTFEASKQRVFLTTIIEGDKYVVVSDLQSGMVLVEISDLTDNKNSPTITGNIRWLNYSEMDSIQFNQKKFGSAIAANSTTLRRQSFGEWYRLNWGDAAQNDGQTGR